MRVRTSLNQIHGLQLSLLAATAYFPWLIGSIGWIPIELWQAIKSSLVCASLN